MGYRGIVKGNLIVLLEVWGSQVPDDGWDAVEKAVEELDRADREYEGGRSHA